MGFLIYKAEIDAGIAEEIQSNASLAYIAQAKPSSLSDVEQNNIKDKLVKANQDKQFDLFYLDAILVSVGWNNNDDVFDTKETWIARHTPIDKQFNFQHDETDIIGHITASYALDTENNKIADNIPVDNLPNKFDIVVSSVLYKCWSDQSLKERMSNIIREIAEGKWFVSMECLFNNFDYALISPEGEHKILARNEQSAFLSKYLRKYGGSGEFQGNKIGRLLRNYTFSGKGLVKNPANPKSVIFNETNSFQGTKALISVFTEKNSMSDNNLTEKVLELEKALSSVRSENDDLNQKLKDVDEKVYSAKIDKLQNQVDELKSSTVEKDELVESQEKTISELEEEVKKRDENLTNVEKELNELQAQAKLNKRLAKLAEVGVDGEKASELVKKFADANDEMFDSIVELSKSSNVNEDEVDATDNDNESESSESVAEETDLDEAVTDKQADLNVDVDTADEVNRVRSMASDWFKSVSNLHKEQGDN